jgi:hypothetical protein
VTCAASGLPAATAATVADPATLIATGRGRGHLPADTRRQGLIVPPSVHGCGLMKMPTVQE